MQLRIPYTAPLPVYPNLPSAATTLPIAIAAVCNFLRVTPSEKTVTVVSGAGISVDSGLKDYRGREGTYILNKSYRPTFYREFVDSDERRRRYWARSYTGWQGVLSVAPNQGHIGVERLWRKGFVGSVITQNVDSLHELSNPLLPVTALHGSLRHVRCLHCHSLYDRDRFQDDLGRLNPIWQNIVHRARTDKAFEDQLRPNPDGDIDVPDAPYSSFRYPACKTCLEDGNVDVDNDGAYLASNGSGSAGILKPTIIFFGESLETKTRTAAEAMIEADEVDGILVLGTSLATYSAHRLVKMAKELKKRIGIINVGGVRGEDQVFWGPIGSQERKQIEEGDGTEGFRINFGISETLTAVNEVLDKEEEIARTRTRPLVVGDTVQTSHGSVPIYGF